MGDININFVNGVVTSEKWRSVVDTFQLTQIITSPTRVTATTDTLIDHIYTTHPQHVRASKVGVLYASDNLLVVMLRKRNSTKAAVPCAITYRQYRHFDANHFVHDLHQMPWSDIAKHTDVGDALDAWISCFVGECDIHAPVKHRKVKRKQQPDWLTGDIVGAMQERDRHKSQGRWDNNNMWRNKVTDMIQSAKTFLYQRVIEENTINPRQLWAHLREMCPRNKTRTPCVIRDGEQELTEPEIIANTFNEYFTNIASQYTSDSQDTRQQQHTQLKHFVSDKLDTSFSIPEIKQHTVYRALMILRSDKSTGADNISARLLKAAAPAIIVSVTTLINKSIVSGKFPTLWKLAKITPIHKKEPTESKGNYRPISILCALSKILERYVHGSLYTYIMSHNILHDGQSDFRAKHSCETALNHMVHKWASAIDKGLVNGVVLLDLRKAFDIVSHTILLDKLSIYGCSQQSMRWFSS